MDDIAEIGQREEHPQHWIELIAVLLMLEFLIVIFIISYPKTVVLQTQPAVPYESMMNLVTWTQSNGYSSIQWNSITELSIFHVWPNPNGTISYDGGLSNLATIISTAHSHNVKVFLAFGGDGVNPTIINNILANQTLQTIFINNLITEVQAKGYDGLHVDFEGTFNKAQFTVFMQHLSSALWAKNPNYLIDVQVADWESSDFNAPGIEPYTTHFNIMYNPTLADTNSWAAQLQNPAKMAAGYDFADDPETPSILLPKLVADRQANYGFFFWTAETANASYYSVIEQALATGGSTSTSTAGSTTTATSSTSTSSTQTTSTISAPPPQFTQGESVKILYPTTLWANPSTATSIGTVAVGTTGPIIAQPQYNTSLQLWFYDISFTTSQVGWVKETQLGINNATTTSTASTSTTLSTSTSSSSSSSTTAATTTSSKTTTSSSTSAASTSTSATTTLTSSTTTAPSTSATTTLTSSTTTAQTTSSSTSSSTAPTTSTSTSVLTTSSTVPTTSTTVPTTTTSTIGTVSSTSVSTTIPTTTISTTVHTTTSSSTSSSSSASTSSAPTTSSTSSSTTTTIPLAKFSQGEGIKTVFPTILWQTPTNAINLGTMPVGSTGTIIAQPHFDNTTQIWFYDVTFTSNQLGWIKETQVVLNNIITTTSSSTSSSTSSTAATTSSASTSISSSSTSTAISTSTSSAQTTSASTTTITVPTTSTTAPTTTTSTIGTVSTSSATTTIPTTTISTTIHTTSTTLPSTSSSTSSSSSASTSTSSSPTTSSSSTSQSTTSSTSTGSSTSSTSASTTTINPISTLNSTVSVNGIVSSNSPILVNVISANTLVKVVSNSPVNAMVTISNATGIASPLASNNLLLAMSFNAVEQSANVPLNTSVTTGYLCSIPSNEIGVFLFANSIWNPIKFAVNSISCKISYNLTFDPVVGIFVQTKSNATTTTIAPTTTTISSGGSGGGGGGGGGNGGSGGGGGSSKPVKTKTVNGYTITNVAQLNTFNVTLGNQTIKFVENYITPTSAGLTINGNSSYVLNTTGNYVIGSGSNSINVKLLNISYLPIEQTIALYVYPSQSTSNSTINSTAAQPVNITISATNLLSAKVVPASLAGSIVITNETLVTPQAPSNYTKLVAMGVSITAPGVLLANMSVSYPCNISSNSIAPYVLNGSYWVAITPFSVNPSSCYASFVTNRNSTIALMEFSPATQTIPATTTIVGGSAGAVASGVTTKIVSTKGLPNYIYIIAGIIVLALVGAMLYVMLKRVSGNSMISKRHVFLVYALVLMGAAVAIAYGYVAVHSLYITPTPPVLIQPNTTTTIPINASSTFVQQFQEFDLPMGTSWTVMLGNTLSNGSVESGTANLRSGYLNYSTGFINFTVHPGSYYYTVPQVPGYNLVGYPLRDQGYINTSQHYDLEGIPTSKGQILQGIFVQCTSNCNSSVQTLTFERFGLPDASNWSVTVDNATNSSSSYFLNFTESVGMHNYSIGNVQGYVAYPQHGSVNLTRGSSVYSVAVTFVK